MIAHLPNHFSNPDNSFVLINHPFSNEIHIAFAKNEEIELIADLNALNNKEGFVFAPFNTKVNKTYLLPQSKQFKIPKNKFEQLLENQLQNIKLKLKCSDDKALIYNNLTEEKYLTQIANTIALINNEEINKVVFTKTIVKKLKADANPLQVFNLLVNDYESACCYFVKIKNEIWLGASPETLVSYDNKYLKTMALAGTLPKDKAESNEYKWSKKEFEEHYFVSHHIQQKLESLGLHGSIAVPKTMQAGNLVHLQTDFNYTSNNNIHSQIGNIVNGLHPTPAVAGTPVNLSLPIIEEMEQYNRSYYTGFLGFLNQQKGHLFVNLRCMKWQNNEAIIFVGGGITKDSNPKKEWEETELKAKTMLLALADSIEE